MKSLDDFKAHSLNFSRALSNLDFKKFEKTGELFIHQKRKEKLSTPFRK